MGHRADQFQEFVLTFSSPWNLAGKTTEEWSQSFYVSGTITHNDADAETAALALAQPALTLAATTTHLARFAYYPSGSLVSTVNKTYAPGQHPGTQNAYSAAGGGTQQLEVAAVAHCPIGKNSRGKEIYLRKYFHNVSAAASDPNALNPLSDPVALLAPFNTGAGPHSVVPCSPSSGHTGGPWTMEAHLFTHQLRKGKKRKPTQSQSLFAELVKVIGEAAALQLLQRALAGAATGA